MCAGQFFQIKMNKKKIGTASNLGMVLRVKLPSSTPWLLRPINELKKMLGGLEYEPLVTTTKYW